MEMDKKEEELKMDWALDRELKKKKRRLDRPFTSDHYHRLTGSKSGLPGAATWRNIAGRPIVAAKCSKWWGAVNSLLSNDYDQQGPMYDDQLDPLIEEILWTEERILYLDLALVMECSLFEPPYCRDYSLTREEQIEANRDAIQARERFLKIVQEERQLLQTQKDNEQREYWEHMQKMLEDFKKAMEQQEEMEEIVVLEEDEESETESETESNNVSILEYPQTPSPLYIENKIALAEMIAREEPVLEKSEPTTDPLDSDTDESDESIDEKIPCDAEPIPSIETITEDSGEGHVVIIEPATESQPIEDLESQILALKANDVDTPRRLPPPPIQDESPPFFLLPPSRRNESKILDFDWKRTEQRWHQRRVKKVKLYDSRIGGAWN
ncbi:unnamed protein product [Cuscuta campestris]|uniref:Uncharacterized protein n=1 Tax=Cuscuta campestris TaxID=132261 RepID=A0A484LBN1_9ASTE|nr:unnamed protein product [Cuscuta campestris]